MRIDPDHVARTIDVRALHATPALGHQPTLQWYVVAEPVDNVPVGIGALNRSTLLSSQTDSEDTDRGRHFIQRTPTGSKTYDESDPGPVFDPTRTVARAGNPHFNTGTYEVPFQIGRVEGARDESRRAVTMTRNECRRALLLRRGGDT
jgi:hypothetical protein